MYDRFKRTKLWQRMTAVIVLFGVGIFGIAFGAHEALNNSNAAISENQVRCEAGNELRAGLREEKDTEIEFLENLPKLFPGAPPGTFKQYADAQIKNIEHNKATVFANKEC